MTGKHMKLVREGEYVAEVQVELIESEDPWAPYLSLADARRLDDVRVALKGGDLAAATKLAKVYRLASVGA